MSVSEMNFSLGRLESRRSSSELLSDEPYSSIYHHGMSRPPSFFGSLKKSSKFIATVSANAYFRWKMR